MKYFDWDEDKNQKLKNEREVAFEDVVVAIFGGELIDIIEHNSKKKYKNQKIYVINIENYIYLVPFVEDNNKYFLKTMYPSRKMTKKYLIERK